MKLLEREIKLAILDLDGTLIDSTGIWHDIDTNFFARRGMEIPNGYFDAICHLGLKATATYTKTTYGIKESEEEIIKEWQDASKDQYLNYIQLKPYVKEFLEYLKNNSVKIALATANDKELYEPCMKRLGIFDYFDYIVDVNSVKEGKHSPRIYEIVNENFNIDKANTIVVEDISTSLQTAYENGYITIGVADKASEPTREQKLKYSHIYVENLNELIK
ncbi:MAG: HAD family phosphatase [Bacilli bacterium]|nr:HAD family phosphatase [Bacilli bacterium]